MAHSPKTGAGGTITFGTSGFTGCILEIGASEFELGALEAACLDTTTAKKKIPDDLPVAGQFNLRCYFDPAEALPPLGSSETITITFPKTGGLATAGKLVGSGWFKKGGTPEMKNSQLMEQTFTIRWSGVVGPTFTAEHA